MTGNIKRRINELFKGDIEGFSSKYRCKYLLYYEKFDDVNMAISREKQLKKWNRTKKSELISSKNPEYNYLNETIFIVHEQYL